MDGKSLLLNFAQMPKNTARYAILALELVVKGCAPPSDYAPVRKAMSRHNTPHMAFSIPGILGTSGHVLPPHHSHILLIICTGTQEI